MHPFFSYLKKIYAKIGIAVYFFLIFIYIKLQLGIVISVSMYLKDIKHSFKNTTLSGFLKQNFIWLLIVVCIEKVKARYSLVLT